MIVVDASALLAIFLNEPERDAFLEVIAKADRAAMTPVNAWEALARAHVAGGEAGRARMAGLIEAFDLEVLPCTMVDAHAAVIAFTRYGRRTAANLNLGDCFAYALAQRHGAALLFKGDDFARTDVTPAA